MFIHTTVSWNVLACHRDSIVSLVYSGIASHSAVLFGIH